MRSEALPAANSAVSTDTELFEPPKGAKETPVP